MKNKKLLFSIYYRDMKNTPTAEQIEALKLFAKANGRSWKSELNTLWMNGAYNCAVLGGADPASLQQVRNQFGPSWLVRFKLPAAKSAGLEGLELTNGEGAEVEGLAHFLGFMKSESAPVPETGEEMDALLTRYMKTMRRGQMEYVSKLRIERGQ